MIHDIAAVPHLDVIETVDSEKLAASINRSWGSENRTERLKVFVQINTSHEDSKLTLLKSGLVCHTHA